MEITDDILDRLAEIMIRNKVDKADLVAVLEPSRQWLRILVTGSQTPKEARDRVRMFIRDPATRDRFDAYFTALFLITAQSGLEAAAMDPAPVK